LQKFVLLWFIKHFNKNATKNPFYVEMKSKQQDKFFGISKAEYVVSATKHLHLFPYFKIVYNNENIFPRSPIFG